MAVQDCLYTAHDLWNMPDDGKVYELHNGVLVEVGGSGFRQTALAAWLVHLLTAFIMEHNLGGVVTGADGTFVLAPFSTRIPDVAYTKTSLQFLTDTIGFYVGAPDLAIEVVSPSNTPQEMQQRAGEYLNAGTELIWIVDPEAKTVDVYRRSGERITVKGDSILSGYDVLPDLQLSLKQVFNPFQHD